MGSKFEPYLSSCHVTVRGFTIWEHFPECDTITPHITGVRERPVIDWFRCIPKDREREKMRGQKRRSTREEGRMRNYRECALSNMQYKYCIVGYFHHILISWFSWFEKWGACYGVLNFECLPLVEHTYLTTWLAIDHLGMPCNNHY